MILLVITPLTDKCYMTLTGASSELLDDFRAMKEIKTLTHSDAPEGFLDDDTLLVKSFESLLERLAKLQICLSI